MVDDPATDTGASGFWSYVHQDNDQSSGRILRLAELIQNEFSMLTGRDLTLFLDRKSLDWGDQWRGKIETALQDTTFFIPVVTPRFFSSSECRRELLKFSGQAKALDAINLLLPILFVDVPDLTEDSADEAKALVASSQYFDWRDLRLTDENSEPYARAVNTLAMRLAAIAREYEAKPSVVPSEPVDAATDSADSIAEEELGLNDLLAEMEPKLPLFLETLEDFSPLMHEIGEITNSYTSQFQSAANDSFAKRVQVARKYAAEIDQPASNMQSKGEEYATRLLALDPGVRAMITLAEEQTEPEEIASACEMFESLRGLANASRDNEGVLNDFIESLGTPSRLFKDLRPAMNKMRTGLQSVLDAQTVMDEWTRLMDESSLDCAGKRRDYQRPDQGASGERESASPRVRESASHSRVRTGTDRW